MTKLAIILANLLFGYLNPVLPGFYPDPSVCRVNEDYYLVNSSFQYFPGVPIFHSKDLIHWEQIGNVLDRESQLPLAKANAWGGIYAPTIRYNEGKFYMISTNVSGKGNFFVTAENPAGPWSEPVWLEQGGIDPSLYWEDGKCYYCSNPKDGIYLCEIDDITGKQLTESKLLWRGDGGRYPEAPHIYKINGWYYLMIAEGGTEYGHSETIARSRNIYGPYESNPDNPILCNQRQHSQSCEIQGTGHADLVQAHDGSWWAVCLAFRRQNGDHHLLGRETFLVPVEWNSQGWPVFNGNGSVRPEMNVKTLPQMLPDGTPVTENKPLGTRDRIADGKFTFDWMWLNNPIMSNYAFIQGDDGSNVLEMKSSDVSLDTEGISPSFVALRQRSKVLESSVELDLKGAKKGDKAGLSVYMANYAHCDIAVRKAFLGRQKVVVTYSGLGGMKYEIGSVRVKRGKVKLMVNATDNGYTFSCTDRKGKISNLGFLDCRYLSTETVNGFVGITYGLFAVNEEGHKPFTARFHSFIHN